MTLAATFVSSTVVTSSTKRQGTCLFKASLRQCDTNALFTLAIYCSRPVARVHTASTAVGSSGTLRPHQEVFAVDVNGSCRLGVVV